MRFKGQVRISQVGKVEKTVLAEGRACAKPRGMTSRTEVRKDLRAKRKKLRILRRDSYNYKIQLLENVRTCR